MNIFEFADIIDKNLDIKYHPNQNGRFSVQFEYGEIKKDSFLHGCFGDGKNITEAINDYIKQIANKKMVFNAYRDNRQEFIVPEIIEIVNNGS